MSENKRQYFYEDFENTEFFSQGVDLYRRTSAGPLKIFTVDSQDNPENRDAFICWVRDHENYAVILIDWAIKRNILVFDRNDNKVLYQLHDPKDVFASRPNSWVNIYTKHQELDNECFVAVSVDRYHEFIRYRDGKVLKSVDPRGNDPRDF